jgi:hypothetical protein
VNDEPKQELAYVFRVTERGLFSTYPRVLAEFQGAILYTVEEQFQPGRREQFAPNIDIWSYTTPRVIGLDIALDVTVSELTLGTMQDVYDATEVSVGVELWKQLGAAHHGERDDLWYRLRFHNCKIRIPAPGQFEVRATHLPFNGAISTGQAMPQGEDTQKMRGTDDE